MYSPGSDIFVTVTCEYVSPGRWQRRHDLRGVFFSGFGFGRDEGLEISFVPGGEGGQADVGREESRGGFVGEHLSCMRPAYAPPKKPEVDEPSSIQLSLLRA